MSSIQRRELRRFYEDSNSSNVVYCDTQLRSYMSMLHLDVDGGPVYDFAEEYMQSMECFFDYKSSLYIEIFDLPQGRLSALLHALHSFRVLAPEIMHEFYEILVGHRWDESQSSCQNQLEQYCGEFNLIMDDSELSVLGKIAWAYWKIVVSELFETECMHMAVMMANFMGARFRLPFPIVEPFQAPQCREMLVQIQRPGGSTGPCLVTSYLEPHVSDLWKQSHSFHYRRMAAVATDYASRPPPAAALEKSCDDHQPDTLSTVPEPTDLADDLAALPEDSGFNVALPSVDPSESPGTSSTEATERTRQGVESECGICMDSEKDCDIMMLCCKQQFHIRCVDEWLTVGSGRSNCPQCRRNIHFPQRVTPDGVPRGPDDVHTVMALLQGLLHGATPTEDDDDEEDDSDTASHFLFPEDIARGIGNRATMATAWRREGVSRLTGERERAERDSSEFDSDSSGPPRLVYELSEDDLPPLVSDSSTDED